MLTLADVERGLEIVREAVPPTPTYRWPLLCERIGLEVWVKHENHTPTGAFKVRGGLTFMRDLKTQHPDCPGVILATRGNHGQSIAFAATRSGIPCTIYVPEGNSREKNASMKAWGAELVIEGHDFQASAERARRQADEHGLVFVPTFSREVVRGVATYAYELFRAVPDLDAIYVPVGMGSGICSVITVRDLLSPGTEVIGVVSDQAPAYKLSFERGEPVSTDTADTFVDGVAVRTPDPAAIEVLCRGAQRVVEVSDAEVEEAMRVLYTDTHNVAEPAGAAALAGLARERDSMRGRRVAVIQTGGNVDRDVFAKVMAGSLP